MWKREHKSARKRNRRSAGFTLIEALIAVALMAVILTGLASITSQWLPNWNRGIARAQRSEVVRLALDRLVSDVAASEFVTPNRDSNSPLFDGTEFSITIVRTAVGPNTRPGLEIVRIGQIGDKDGAALVRAAKPFAPLEPGATFVAQSDFANQTVLLRSPYQVSFAYAGRDKVWRKDWQNADRLPAAVRLTIYDARSGRPLTISTIALVHVELPATCVGGKGKGDCIDGTGANKSPDNPSPIGSGKQRT
jgi:general secretion pathway protein J